MHSLWSFLRIALPGFAVVWLVGAPVAGWLGHAQALVVWTAAAVLLLLVGIAGELAVAFAPAAKSSPLTRMFLGMMTRGVLVVGLVVLAYAETPLDAWVGDERDAWVGDKRAIAFSVIPFYFALLAVEVFAAKSILASPQSAPPRSTAERQATAELQAS